METRSARNMNNTLELQTENFQLVGAPWGCVKSVLSDRGLEHGKLGGTAKDASIRPDVFRMNRRFFNLIK